MKWQLTLQIGINNCPGDKGIDRDYQRERGRWRDGDKEGGKKQTEKYAWWETVQPIGKLLPWAFVCCVCADHCFGPY